MYPVERLRGFVLQYYTNYKLNTTTSIDADYRTYFLNYVGLAAQIPNLLLAATNVFFQSGGGYVNLLYFHCNAIIVCKVKLISSLAMYLCLSAGVGSMFCTLCTDAVTLARFGSVPVCWYRLVRCFTLSNFRLGTTTELTYFERALRLIQV